MRTFIRLLAAAAASALLLGGCVETFTGPLAADASPRIGASDLGGRVTSASGVEAGVWVIAETNELPTKFAKIVVTDERGRYVMPDLPKATYSVWVRGYGLIDSQKVRSAPG